MKLILLSFLLFILLGLSAFFSASETALFSLSAPKLALFKTSTKKGKIAAAKLLSNPKSLLITTLIMNIAVNLGVQNVTSSIFGTLSGLLLTVFLPFVLTLIFGEIIPKIVAVTKDEAVASIVAPIILMLNALLFPIRYICLKITKFGSAALSLFLKKDKEITREEIKHAIISSKDSGMMTKDEIKLLLGSLKLSELLVSDVKCPRQNIFFHEKNDSLQKLRDLFVEKRLSKIPIVDRSLDNVVGIVYALSFFSSNHTISEQGDLEKVMQKPFFIPESMLARTLLAKFYENNLEIAMLVDEYGSISGLITKEDLVEIVVGQIKDVREEKTLFTRQGEDVIICSGKYDLTDLEQLFEIEINRQAAETTVAGYLLEILGDIPKSGYKVTKDHLFFHVLLATETKVSRVYIKNLQKRGKKGE